VINVINVDQIVRSQEFVQNLIRKLNCKIYWQQFDRPCFVLVIFRGEILLYKWRWRSWRVVHYVEKFFLWKGSTIPKKRRRWRHKIYFGATMPIC